MRYLVNPSSEAVREVLRRGWIDHPGTGARMELGQMTTPAEGREPLTGDDGEPVWFAADNGCFSAKGAINADRWHTWLTKLVAGREHRCLFAVAPDLFNPDLGNDMGVTSLQHSRTYFSGVRELGVPVAVVAQNGLTPAVIAPYWREFDVLFLGGCVECVPCRWVPTIAQLERMRTTKNYTCPICRHGLTEWKESRAAQRLAHAAKPEWRPDSWKSVHLGRLNSARRRKLAEVFGVDTADGTFLTYGPDKNLARLARWPDDNLFSAAA
ncbi:hypothetical protein AB0A74_02880 [Saccharothrix sp. NPDC042600]|uniref:hypothetical protein n=1 Tax=Saccharothrix TaxID=2071 RepID=UPI0033C2AFCD|nr:hypothetical protein GCM10017745_67230 [Saccharothrix mutabilis subsp. capreolus]